jgi:hypothetical protein
MSARNAFRQLLERHGLTQAEAAAVICRHTQRPCAVRTVRSWVNDPTKDSSRECPQWAVDVLRSALEPAAVAAAPPPRRKTAA